ncbi:MAG: RNA-binding protein [Clostridiales bacterium]|jgi:ribosomal protein L14E/L6E/L27E|nr:RNA-binding protein [Clostridiales bacterium]
MCKIGCVVISKRGHDKGRPFVIVGTDGDFLYLADGDLRKLAKPKKKKLMHVQNTESISTEIAEMLETGSPRDEDLRKVLLRFGKNGEV